MSRNYFEKFPRYHTLNDVEKTDFEYEFTITMNPNLWCATSDYDNSLKNEILDTFAKNDKVEFVYMVKEYQKNNAPHFHCLIQTNAELIPTYRASLMKKFTSEYGLSSFRPVRDLEKFLDYLSKDLNKNLEERHYDHISAYVSFIKPNV